MRIYNTLSKRKEEFVPLEPGKVKIYACGPTVYNYIHIGNARPICVFDVLRRYLEYKGYEVKFVQNFTDIDDKLIKKANEEGITLEEVANRFIKEYKIDAAGLGVRPADVHPRATETVPKIIEVIQDIIDHGYGYESNGDVYYRSRKFKEYGKLSHMPIEDLESGSRVDLNEQKEDPLDFALWKAAKPGEPSWQSPWGMGRPGWHIECTAMIREHLGETIDIHCGGQDLVFPHHENEIAQGECCTGKEYAKYWMHNGFINVDNQKMSKSLGNFFTTRDVAEKFGYEPIKYLMLSSHYRSPINYSYDSITQCVSSLERLHNCRDNMDFALRIATDISDDGEAVFIADVDKYVDKFTEAMDDDLNTADGISSLFEMARVINTYLTVPRNKSAVQYAIEKFDQITDVLGLLYNRKGDNVDSEIEELIAKREQARKDKNFAESDRIRDELKARGIEIKDTAQGMQWTYIK